MLPQHNFLCLCQFPPPLCCSSIKREGKLCTVSSDCGAHSPLTRGLSSLNHEVGGFSDSVAADDLDLILTGSNMHAGSYHCTIFISHTTVDNTAACFPDPQFDIRQRLL